MFYNVKMSFLDITPLYEEPSTCGHQKENEEKRSSVHGPYCKRIIPTTAKTLDIMRRSDYNFHICLAVLTGSLFSNNNFLFKKP